MQPGEVSRFIIERLEAVGAEYSHISEWQSECKAISAFLPYVAWQERHGNHVTLDAISRIIGASEAPTWNRVLPALFNRNSPRTTLFASHHTDWPVLTWGFKPLTSGHERLVSEWAAAATAAPYTEEVGQSVVNALLRILSTYVLHPHIPIGMWAWLEKQPALPPKSLGRLEGSEGPAVHHVRTLGDIKILKSYLLLVWSEWVCPPTDGVSEMCTSIRSDFSGSGMRHHRGDLIKRLDDVLGEMDRGLGYLRQRKPWMHESLFYQAKERYRMLREVVLQVDRRGCKS